MFSYSVVKQKFSSCASLLNDYVIADTVFRSPVLWVSKTIFMNSNQMQALKLPTG